MSKAKVKNTKVKKTKVKKTKVKAPVMPSMPRTHHRTYQGKGKWSVGYGEYDYGTASTQAECQEAWQAFRQGVYAQTKALEDALDALTLSEKRPPREVVDVIKEGLVVRDMPEPVWDWSRVRTGPLGRCDSQSAVLYKESMVSIDLYINAHWKT